MSHECHFMTADGCEKEAKHSLPMSDGNTMWLCEYCYDKTAEYILAWSEGSDGEARKNLAAEYLKRWPSVARHFKKK